MVSASTLLKKFANVNHSVIDSYEFEQNFQEEVILKINLHPQKAYSNCCPVCGCRCKVYDRSPDTRMWRALDCGGIIIELYSPTCRVKCPLHPDFSA